MANALSEPLFRLLVDSVEECALCTLDSVGLILTWNRGAQQLLGYEESEVVGRPITLMDEPSDSRAAQSPTVLELSAKDGRAQVEGWRVRKDGSTFWAEVTTTSVKDSNGTVTGYAQVIRDLIERRRAVEADRVQEQRFRLLIESVRDYAIFLLDPKGNVTTWNPGAARLKGYTADEIIGRHFSIFYPDSPDRAALCAHELLVAEVEGRFEDEGWRVRKDGSQFWGNVIISAVRDAQGALVGFSKVTRDLTLRKQTEEAAAARRSAELANRTKDEFLAMLGHELRNPLAPIVSALQLLKLRGDAKSAREHQVIERQVKQMIRIVDDLLDVSRISRGKIELRHETTDLRDALGKAMEMAMPLFEKKGQSFEVTVPPHALWVLGDEARLTQVFANLLNNAGKYTPASGRITLNVREDEDQIEIAVHDNGNGIDDEMLPRVFELFVQGPQDSARSDGGLGMGLTLVRALVERHAGTVTASSAGLKRGSTFTVRLPLGLPPRVATVEASSPRGQHHRRRVLVVDDNEDGRQLLAESLASMGHEVQMAVDGPSALEALQSFAADAAVLDVGLPGMSGLELATKLKAQPSTRDLRLIAVTGYGQSSDRAASAQAGFALHLVKPVDVEELSRFLSKS